jgi:hypothetical protein
MNQTQIDWTAFHRPNRTLINTFTQYVEHQLQAGIDETLEAMEAVESPSARLRLLRRVLIHLSDLQPPRRAQRLAALLYPLWPQYMRREVSQFQGEHHRGMLAAANLCYDVSMLCEQPGVGCTTYANPTTGEFCRSLDWVIPVNIGPYLRRAEVETAMGPLISHVVPGIIGFTTVESPHFCLALNMAPSTQSRSASEVLCRLWQMRQNHLPALQWARELIFRLTDMQAALPPRAEPAAVVKAVARCVDGLYGEHPSLSPAIITFMLGTDLHILAFRCELADGDQRPTLVWSADQPLAASNHYQDQPTSMRRQHVDDDSAERLQSALRDGPRAFHRQPVHEPELCALNLHCTVERMPARTTRPVARHATPL